MRRKKAKPCGPRRMRKWFLALVISSTLLSTCYLHSDGLLILVTRSAFFCGSTKQVAKFTVNHIDSCHHNQTLPIQLVIAVISKVDHSRQRSSIRQSWGTIGRRRDTKVFFFLVSVQPQDGAILQDVLREDRLYGDLIVKEFTSSDFNFHLPMTLNWTYHHCAPAQYLLQVDDRSFLNPSRLYQFLATAPESIHSVEMPPCRTCKDDGGSLSYLIGRREMSLLYGTMTRMDCISPASLDQVRLVDRWAQAAGLSVKRTEGYDAAHLTDMCFSRQVMSIGRVSENSMRMIWWFINDDRLQNCTQSLFLKTAIKKGGR